MKCLIRLEVAAEHVVFDVGGGPYALADGNRGDLGIGTSGAFVGERGDVAHGEDVLAPRYSQQVIDLDGGALGRDGQCMPGSAAGREDLHFRERAFWLYSTGHRLGDLRRLIRQYGRGAETVFPTGAYFKGGLYGTDVNLPIPQEEENNANFTACLDRNA